MPRQTALITPHRHLQEALAQAEAAKHLMVQQEQQITTLQQALQKAQDAAQVDILSLKDRGS